MKIGMSLVGRIENNITLGGGKFFIPLFEAISNSIHAIDDAGEQEGWPRRVQCGCVGAISNRELCPVPIVKSLGSDRAALAST